MAFKIFVLAALVAAVQGGIVAPVAAPVVAAKVVDTEYDPNPQYTYAYDVQDSLTGDSKNQFETRNGDVVQGRYSLIEADGTRRIVDYTADPINGFNAVVQREPVAVVAPAVAKVVAPAPVAKVVAPVAAPVALPAFARYAAAVPAFAKFAAPVAVPAVAKVAAPFVAAQYAAAPLNYPVAAPLSYPLAAKVAAPVVAPAPFAKLAYPSPLAYSAPFASPYTKVVSPFGYSAAYNSVF